VGSVAIYPGPRLKVKQASTLKIGLLEMRDPCKIKTGGNCEKKEILGGAAILVFKKG
jgi:hypothetical protein